MPYNFYWRNEAEIVSGAVSFASLISSSPESYGISSEQAASFSALSVALKSAYLAATTPGTRTIVAVAEKNGALKAMRTNAMLLANIAYANPAVADAQLIELGLNPRATRSPIRVPDQAPALHVTGVSQRLVSLVLRPSDSNRRGKPFGAAGANLYSFLGENPPSDPRAYFFEKMTTRARTQLQFNADVANGATVWLSACWVSARGHTSPFCSPVNTIIQGGGIVMTRSLAA
jgi:hypothetical protein